MHYFFSNFKSIIHLEFILLKVFKIDVFPEFFNTGSGCEDSLIFPHPFLDKSRLLDWNVLLSDWLKTHVLVISLPIRTKKQGCVLIRVCENEPKAEGLGQIGTETRGEIKSPLVSRKPPPRCSPCAEISQRVKSRELARCLCIKFAFKILPTVKIFCVFRFCCPKECRVTFLWRRSEELL